MDDVDAGLRDSWSGVFCRMGGNDSGKPTSPGFRITRVAESSSRRVLLADDDDAILRSLGRALKDRGFEVVSVRDGDAAVKALLASSFDVILSDIHMPGMSGVDLVRVIRAYDLD